MWSVPFVPPPCLHPCYSAAGVAFLVKLGDAPLYLHRIMLVHSARGLRPPRGCGAVLGVQSRDVYVGLWGFMLKNLASCSVAGLQGTAPGQPQPFCFPGDALHNKGS